MTRQGITVNSVRGIMCTFLQKVLIAYHERPKQALSAAGAFSAHVGLVYALELYVHRHLKLIKLCRALLATVTGAEQVWGHR